MPRLIRKPVWLNTSEIQNDANSSAAAKEYFSLTKTPKSPRKPRSKPKPKAKKSQTKGKAKASQSSTVLKSSANQNDTDHYDEDGIRNLNQKGIDVEQTDAIYQADGKVIRKGPAHGAKKRATVKKTSLANKVT